MRTILHILTRPADDLTLKIIEHQRALPEIEVAVSDLTKGEPNYERLVEQVFEVDSVQVS